MAAPAPTLARPHAWAWLALALASGLAVAAPQRYDLDPSHTYPSFEADHMGLSTWRGKFRRSQGWVLLDREAGRGELDVVVDVDSLDFGHDGMNRAARGPSLFDAEQHPHARYQARLVAWEAGRPTRAEGTLSLKGQQRPLVLEIRRFACKPHPLFRREVCGADALGQFDRSDFGISQGRELGFDMQVTLRIQVEALAAAPVPP